MMTSKDIENRLKYHSPNEAKRKLHEEVRSDITEMVKRINHIVPEGRELALFITKMEEALFWANAAIARSNEE